MPESTFVQEGGAIDYTPGGALAAGEVVVIGELVGVTRTPVAAGTPGSLAVAGVFDFTKATGGGTALAAGAVVYWDDTNNRATSSSGAGANKLIGKVVQAATDGDATVRVRLSQ